MGGNSCFAVTRAELYKYLFTFWSGEIPKFEMPRNQCQTSKTATLNISPGGAKMGGWLAG